MSQRMPPVQYIMTGVSGSAPCSAAGSGAPFAPAGVSRNWSCRMTVMQRSFTAHMAVDALLPGPSMRISNTAYGPNQPHPTYGSSTL
jgi:hypothetical protein